MLCTEECLCALPFPADRAEQPAIITLMGPIPPEHQVQRGAALKNNNIVRVLIDFVRE